MKLGKKIESSVCVLCVLASSVCVWKAVLLLSLVCLSAFSYCWKPVRTFLLQTHQVNLLPLHWGRAAAFPAQIWKIHQSVCDQIKLWPSGILLALNQTLQETPRDAGNSWGCAGRGVMGGWRHRAGGEWPVSSLSVSPSSQWAATDVLWWWWLRAPEPQAQCTVTDQIHLPLLCFPVGSSWFLVQAHFLQSTCWGHEVTAPINQQTPNTLIQEQKEVFSYLGDF